MPDHVDEDSVDYDPREPMDENRRQLTTTQGFPGRARTARCSEPDTYWPASREESRIRGVTQFVSEMSRFLGNETEILSSTISQYKGPREKG